MGYFIVLGHLFNSFIGTENYNSENIRTQSDEAKVIKTDPT